MSWILLMGNNDLCLKIAMIGNGPFALTLSLALTHSLTITHSLDLTLSLTPRRSRQRMGDWGAQNPRKIPRDEAAKRGV